LIFNAIPEPPEPTNSGPVCEGNDVTLFANGAADAYEWTDASGNVISVLENPDVQGLTAGTYTYSLSITIDGCSSSAVGSTTVTIHDLPVADTDVEYELTADCAYSDITLHANVSEGTSPYEYVWTGPNGFSSTLSDPVVANAGVDNNGTYTVFVTDANGCTTTGETQVTTVENPENLPIIASSGPVCEGECITLTTTAYEGSSVNYVWFTPNGTLYNITGENTNELSICPAEAAAHEGAYSVGVTIDGCELTSDEYNLDIFEQPIVTASTIPVCEGSDVVLVGEVTNIADLSGPLTYEWNGPNGFTSNALTVTIANATTADEGTYTLTVSALTACTTTASVEVQLYDTLPAASIDGDEIVCRPDAFTLCTSTLRLDSKLCRREWLCFRAGYSVQRID